MRAYAAIGSLLAAWILGTHAAAVPGVELETRQSSSCVNGPTTRGCWSDGYNISTDFDYNWPTTGETVTYNLEITNGTCNPDGHGDRICFLMNGKYIGPTIRANWGDELVINVQNNMQDNGTSIHWHGVRQYRTPGQDGVGGLTECPLAPGHSRTYKFQATQYGTSWYHAHFSSQYGDGVVGTLQFDGPASANYDVDLGTYPINEWYYKTAFQENVLWGDSLQTGGPGPAADNLLINGTNQDASGAGSYSQVTIESGKKYRLRLINIGVDNFQQVSLDGHTLQIIAADFVPIQPQTVEWLMIAPGQRYDVVIDANAIAGNYWFRTEADGGCDSSNNFHGRAIFTYANVTPATPNILSEPWPLPFIGCQEPTPLQPYWDFAVPDDFSTAAKDLSLNTTNAVVTPNASSIVVWALNKSIDIDWSDPTLSYVASDNTSYPASLNVVPTTAFGQWNYWLIQQTGSGPTFLPHPIHLHGHNFFVLGQGQSSYNAATANLNFKTPTRRDTANIYGNGWLALAFPSNNPGVWLMHCHIAWHISEGLGLQYLEAPEQIVLPDMTAYDDECKAWKEYEPTMYWKKEGSGL